jgi:hypothetical protein
MEKVEKTWGRSAMRYENSFTKNKEFESRKGSKHSLAMEIFVSDRFSSLFKSEMADSRHIAFQTFFFYYLKSIESRIPWKSRGKRLLAKSKSTIKHTLPCQQKFMKLSATRKTSEIKRFRYQRGKNSRFFINK